MTFSGLQMAREQYLERLLARYGTVTLPLESNRQALPLHAVFQPMILHRDPLAPQLPEPVRARDAAEALTRSDLGRIVVLGGPGMGKTTALKALLATAITAAQLDLSAPLPLFLSLPDLVRTGGALEDALAHLVTELEIDQQFADFLMDAVQHGNAFLCLDSLDEVLPAQRPDVLALLNREAPRWQGTWIIGSRFTEYKGGQFVHGQFTEWELQALAEQERLALARQLFPALFATLYGDVAQNLQPALPSAEAYIEELKQSPQMALWGENPLLFSLAAVLYVQTGRLPASRAILYAQVSEAMLSMRIHEPAQRAQLREMLSEMALTFYQTHGRTFSRADMLELLPSLIGDQQPQALSDALTLLLDAGILEPMGYQAYGFKHQMFQEYLAAVALARRCLDQTQWQSTWELLWRKRRLSRWTEIARLLVGVLVQEHGVEGLHIARRWLTALALEKSTDEGDPGHLCLILAMKSLGELGERGTEPGVADLIQQILEIWEQTFTELYRQGGWQYAQSLREQASVLATLSLQMMAPIVLRLQHYDPHIHHWCRIPAGPEIAAQSLPINMLWHLFQDRAVSFYACHTMRVLRTPVVIERLVAILEGPDGSWSIEERALAVELLGKMGEQTPVSLLLKTWQDSALAPDLRKSATQALRDTDIAVPPEHFVAMLQDQHPIIRSVALEALSNRQGDMNTDLFFSALHYADAYVRETALRCLQKNGVALSIELLQTLLYDEHEIVSKLAGERLREMGEAVPPALWLDALQHEYVWVRDSAFLAIAHSKDQVPVEPLLAILAIPKKDTYGHVDVRSHCIRALGLLGERVPLEPLLALLQQSDENICAHALEVLIKRGVVLPAPVLLPMLERPMTGSEAAQALALLGADAPIAALLERAQSHSTEGRHFAIHALRLLSAYVPREPILELLQDEEISNSYMGTYWELVQLLQFQGVEISPELLVSALKRLADQDTIDTVIASLSRAGAQVPLEPLLRLVHEETRRTRFYPKWIEQLFYVLYAWVSPASLTNALGNVPTDQWLAVSLLGLVHDEESVQLIASVAQDPARDQTTRSEAMVILSDLGINLELDYLFQATRWCIYEGMGSYLADTVERLGAQAPLEQLLPLLGEHHNRLQPGVLEALTRIAAHIPLETILPLLEDRQEAVRHAALHILGAMRERAPLAVLAALLGDPAQTLETRCEVIQALGAMGTPAVVDLLVKALDDEETEVRCSALQALQENEREIRQGGLREGQELSLEPLLRLLNDVDGSVVQSAISVLAELASLGVAVPVEPLLSLLNHEDKYIVGGAAEALCTFGARAPIEALLAKMDGADEDSVDAIFSALSSLEAYIPLQAMLATLPESINIAHRWRLGFALETLSETIPEEVLAQLHDDARPVMRRIVLKAIAQTGACTWLPLVLETLADADGRYATYDHDLYGQNKKTVRYAVIEALGALNACAPLESLLPFLYTNTETSSYNDRRIVVLKALKHFGSRVPQTVLWPLLGSDHAEIVRLAFQHMQDVYPDTLTELVPALQALVRGESVQGAFAARLSYRTAETVALMGRATPDVLNMVIDLLEHPFWEVRVRAATTLGTLRRNIPDSAIRRLLELRKDAESPDVRVAADQALAEILSLEQGMEDE